MSLRRDLVKHLLPIAITLPMAGNVAAWELKLGTNVPPIDFHGFVSQGFLYSSDYDYLGETTDGSFEFTEIGLNASFNPFPRTRITAQGFAFDVGDSGNYEPFLDYASLEYTFSDYLGLRGGRVRKPGGIYNHIQDVDLARTSVLLPQGLYDSRWRDFSTALDGGILFGNMALSKAGSLSYEAFGGQVNFSDDGGLSQVIENGLPPAPFGRFHEIDPAWMAGVQLWWNTPLSGLRVGTMFQYVLNFDYEFSIQGVGRLRSESTLPIQMYSLEYVWKSWTFQAEYYNLGLNTETFAGGSPAGQTSTHSDAWYASAAYRFNKWVELGTYYTEYYANTSGRGGDLPTRSDGYQRDAALSLRVDPTEWWIVKLEGHYLRGTALLHDNANNPVRDGDGWWMLALKTTFHF